MGVGRTVDRQTGEVAYISISNNKIDNIALGTSTKSVGNDENRLVRRSTRYRLQGVAASLLPSERVCHCMRSCGHGGVDVSVSPSTGVAAFSGVVTCGSVWHCPVCSGKISNARRHELNRLLAWGRELGAIPLLMTLTTRHGSGDSLAGTLAALKLAKQKLHQSREWAAIKPYLVGHVTATEVTHGANGWHPHFHQILLVDAPSEEIAIEMVESCQVAWLRALRHKAVGLDGNAHAFELQGASSAGDYVTKWGAGEEVGLSGSKRSSKGRTPWMLLEAFERGDKLAGALFREYAQEFKGKRQLVWSRGLKALIGIAEKLDEEIASAPEVDDFERVATLSKSAWRMVVRRGLQAELLEVAEAGFAHPLGAYHFIDCWLTALERQAQSYKRKRV